MRATGSSPTHGPDGSCPHRPLRVDRQQPGRLSEIPICVYNRSVRGRPGCSGTVRALDRLRGNHHVPTERPVPRPALRPARPAERPDRPGRARSRPSPPGRATRADPWPTTSSTSATSTPRAAPPSRPSPACTSRRTAATPSKSLAVLAVGRSTRESLARAGGPDVEATLGPRRLGARLDPRRR